MTKVFGIVLVALWAGAVALVSAQESPSDRYVLNVSLDPEDRVISGTATIDYTNDSAVPLSALYFLLMPNYSREPNPHLAPAVLDSSYWSGFDPAWMKVFSVKTPDGQALGFALERGPDWFQTYSLDDTVLRVALPQPLAPGARTTVVIEFETKFPPCRRSRRGLSQQNIHVALWLEPHPRARDRAPRRTIYRPAAIL
jgi:hypothetical protein